MDRVMLAGLAKIELRGGPTIRLCDGGFLEVGAETYRSSDPDFGTLAGLTTMTEGVGEEVPSGTLTFLPVTTAAAATLSAPGYQGSRIRMWIAEIDEETGLPVGAPDLMGDAMTDRTRLKSGLHTRVLDIEFVPAAERLFVINEGNDLSPRFHRSIWPDEAGMDNGAGVTIQVPWGTDSPPRGVSGASVPSGGSGGRGEYVRVQEQ